MRYKAKVGEEKEERSADLCAGWQVGFSLVDCNHNATFLIRIRDVMSCNIVNFVISCNQSASVSSGTYDGFKRKVLWGKSVIVIFQPQ